MPDLDNVSKFCAPPPATLFLSSNATGFDQDDAAGLAAERAFDCQLLEKGMLLEAAACECTLQMQCSHPRGPSISALAGRAASAGVCLPLSGFASLPAQALLCPKGSSSPRLP